MIIIYYDGGGGRPTGDLRFARARNLYRATTVYFSRRVLCRSRKVAGDFIEKHRRLFADETGNVSTDRRVASDPKRYYGFFFIAFFFLFCFVFIVIASPCAFRLLIGTSVAASGRRPPEIRLCLGHVRYIKINMTAYCRLNDIFTS